MDKKQEFDSHQTKCIMTYSNISRKFDINNWEIHHHHETLNYWIEENLNFINTSTKDLKELLRYIKDVLFRLQHQQKKRNSAMILSIVSLCISGISLMYSFMGGTGEANLYSGIIFTVAVVMVVSFVYLLFFLIIENKTHSRVLFSEMCILSIESILDNREQE
ncbi:hypothetical protein LJC56_03330 [Christensenellaceae bacterium OttesenSCG-928-K19]|nr:hypothetical protein [Christensenellaceae bacterium OttesenSCG-928-K19]